MRKLTAILVPSLLLIAACASTDSSENSGNTTTTEASEGDGAGGSSTTVIEDDRAPGVTDDTVKIGITYTDFEALGDQVSINHGDYEAAYNALIDDINDRGGVHGRMLEAVYAPVDPSNQVSGDEQCTRLTQDEQVFLVLGSFFGESIMCVIDVNETAAIGGDITDERLARAKAPWFSATLGADAQIDAVRTLVEAGELDGTVAAFVPDVDEAVFRSAIEPVLAEGDIEVAEVAVFDSTLEPEQSEAAVAAILERFDASGADTILALGTASGAIAPGLQDTDYRPRLAYTDSGTGNASASAEGQDPGVFEDGVGVAGYGPPTATLDLDGPTEECYDVERAAGLELTPLDEVPEGEPRQLVSSFLACIQVPLLEAMLDAAGEELNYGTFQTAGYELGEILLPGSPEPFSFGPPPSTDGDAPLFIYEWNPGAGEFQIPA